MALKEIIRTLSGRVHGLDKNSDPIYNRRDGSQFHLSMTSGGFMKWFSRLASGAEQDLTLMGYDSGNTLDSGALAALTANGYYPGAPVVAGAPLLFGASGTTVTRNSVNGAGDTSYTALSTITVPGGVMGPNGRLRLTCSLQYTNSASTNAAR